MDRKRIFWLVVAAAFVPGAAHGALYKSVSPEGVVQFSDLPPDNAKKVELIKIPGSPDGAPIVAAAPRDEQEVRERDAAITRASEQLDLAEHALAEARRNLWTAPVSLQVAPTRMSRTDHERVEFYKKNVLAARQNLMQVLTARRLVTAPTMTAGLGTPVKQY